ncbi:MAG: hypothetical protein WCF57_10560 [Pyrinomonadaceae bacterium]
MANEHIATYLNDHLAGSVVAIELLEHLEAAHEGTEISSFVVKLRADIEADRRELESLMERLGITQSPARKASAWMAEKITQIKLRLDDPAGGAFRLFEALEAVEIGIEGKRGLWRALQVASENAPGLRGVDYERLAQRAKDQHQIMEAARLEAAKAALADMPETS